MVILRMVNIMKDFYPKKVILLKNFVYYSGERPFIYFFKETSTFINEVHCSYYLDFNLFY